VALLTATEADVRRFMSYVVPLPCGCWLWVGARSRGGGKNGQRVWYGSFRFKCPQTKKHRTVRAHRFASEVLGKKECPPGHDREHTCELSLCVHDDHIEIVTKAVNQERKVERRRARGPSVLERALEMFHA
jgi:hypothetical protein